MNYLPVLLLSLAATRLCAQVPFEGKIFYTIASPRDKSDARLITYFGPNKIRIEFSDKNDLRGQQCVIVDLDSGKIFTLMPGNKMFSTSLLLEKKTVMLPPSKEIAGYKTTVAGPKAIGSMRLGGMLTYATVYLADELFFPVPEKYLENDLLMMIQKRRIVLGAEVNSSVGTNNGMANGTIENAQNTFSIMADSVIKESLDASMFAVPGNYTEQSASLYRKFGNEIPSKDSVDSVAFATSETLPQKKPEKAPRKKLTRIKDSGLRPKKH